MSNSNDYRNVNDNPPHVSPDHVPDAHDADGTMGRVAGTGAGAIAGGALGSAAGPVGTVVGAVAGAILGAAGGNAAHKIGDDHDDVNVETGSGGDLGRNVGFGAGAISGAAVGSAAGPVGTVAGAVAGGMLGAAGGDAAKDMGGHDDVDVTRDSTYAAPATSSFDDDTSSFGHAAPVAGSNLPSDYNTTVRDNDNMRVPVVEETLDVQKHTQQAGEVVINKHVEHEQVNVPVEVSHENVTVQRHAVDRPLQPGEATLGDNQVIRVPVSEEVVDVNKQAHVVGEVEIDKRRVTEHQTVSDTVRREVVDVNDTTADRVRDVNDPDRLV